MNGPFFIACRGHSGGRVMSEAFIRNRINLGITYSETKDTNYFAPLTNKLLQEVILSAYEYHAMEKSRQQYFQFLMRKCITEYINNEIPEPSKPFGWKFGESIFAHQAILDAYPKAKLIHLIRDGRDVMLSRLESRFGRLLNEPFNKVMVFGDKHAESFIGHPLTRRTVKKLRNELEMIHWVTSVSYGLRGRAYMGRYLEVKYEDLCNDPIVVFEMIFDFLGAPFYKDTQEWLLQNVHQSRVGKWRSLPAGILEQSLQLGKPLLDELGYL